MSAPLVVVDADVLGRRRTGDETYVLNLLRELPALAAAAGLRIAAVTRRPELVPDGIEPPAADRPSPGAAHGVVAAAPAAPGRAPRSCTPSTRCRSRCPCPAVVTIHDLSFERDPTLMSRRDRCVFRRVVPRAAAAAGRVLTVSERTKRDLVELYGVAPARSW